MDNDDMLQAARVLEAVVSATAENLIEDVAR